MQSLSFELKIRQDFVFIEHDQSQQYFQLYNQLSLWESKNSMQQDIINAVEVLND